MDAAIRRRRTYREKTSARTATAFSSLHTTPAEPRIANSVGVCAARATNPPIRRAEMGKNWKNAIFGATNPNIRRAEMGRMRQKWGVCAARATNPPIRRAGSGKNRKNAIFGATNPNIRRAEIGKFDENGVCARRAQRIAGFVARVWAKIGKMPHAMQRITGFVAGVRAKIGKMPHAMQRITGFVARVGAQQGEKVLCVQCMQRIGGSGYGVSRRCVPKGTFGMRWNLAARRAQVLSAFVFHSPVWVFSAVWPADFCSGRDKNWRKAPWSIMRPSS
jgi:hypothetical protein